MDMKKWLDDLTEKAESSHPTNDDDYIGEGDLLYCGKCHTPKEGWYNFPALLGGRQKKPINCRCQAEAFAAEEAERKRREHEETVARLKGSGLPSRALWDFTFENDDGSCPRMSKICRNYADNFKEMKKQKKGLLFFGPVGTGKTFLATCIANRLMEEERPCLVTNFSRIANELWGLKEERNMYLDSLQRYDLLVIDDLGAERRTSYMDEQVYNLIDSRYLSGLPMIVTTNMTAEELKSPDNIALQRVMSRLMECCAFFEVTGKDHRRTRMINDFPEISEILERERGESE